MRPPAAWPRIPPDPALPREKQEWHARWPYRDYVELAADPAAASSARLRVRESLHEWRLDHLADDAGLVTAELVANAVAVTRKTAWELGRPPVRLWTAGARRVVVALVWDASAEAPRLGAPSLDDECGRGLLIVDALAEWGHYRPPRAYGGKVVWARLPKPSEAERRNS
jgi:hypothetical protein